MNDSSEATHYQIELTSRQVLAGLVVLLVCLFAAFFAGVWIGRNAEASSAASELASVDEVARGGERYDFFSKTEAERAAGAGSAGGAGEEEVSALDDFPAGDAPLEGDFGPDAADEELAPTEGDHSTMAGADPDALFEDDAAAGDDLPPPEEMGRGGRRRRAAARAAEEEALAATATDPDLPDDDPAPAPAESRNAATTASAQPAAATQQGGFHIQVLATSDRAKAEVLVKRLVDADFKAILVPSNEGGRTLYRVRVGPFPDRSIAAGAAKELETRWGLDSWISPGAP